MTRSLIGLIISIALTGCSLFGPIFTVTKPIDAADLSVKHIYKPPKKNKFPSYFNGFNDPQLNQLIAIALIDAPDTRSAKARVERARQLAKIAYSTLWPSANLNGYLESAYFPIHGTIPPQIPRLNINKVNIADIGLNFNYELDFWGKNRENLASKLSETFAAQMDLAETQLVLSAAVATAYFDVKNNMIQLSLAKENARLLGELSAIILDRSKQGIESNIPVSTALANAQSAKLSVEDYKRAEMQSRNQLAVLMGKDPLTTQINTTAFIYKQLGLPKIIPANVLAQRPDIGAARALTESAAHQVNVAKTAFFPNFNLKGLLSVESLYFSKAFNIWFPNDNASVAFDLPIFDAGARRANLRVNYAQFELAVNQYNQTILNALKEVGDELSALKTLDAQISAQNKVLKSTQSNYKLYQSQYTQGIIDYTQLIEIKQLLVQQKALLRTIQTRQLQAHIALLTALGGGF